MANPIRKLADALTGTPDVATAEERAKTARQLTIDADGAVEAAKAARTLADEAGDRELISKTEAALISAERAADRATRALQIAEDKLRRAREAAEAAPLAEARKRLAALVAARDRAGKQIEEALVALEAGVKELADIDADIFALPGSVRGSDCVPGHNIGKGAIEMRLAVELAQRGVQGQPSSMALPRFAEWLAVGSNLLNARV